MRNLILSNASFRYLEKSFEEWLDVQGYAASTVYKLPLHVRELLYHLEKEGITNIKALNPKHIEKHYQKLKERSNQRRGGGLSNGHLNKHIQALRKFTEYLRKVGRLEISTITLKDEEAQQKTTYLTKEEIQDLFNATYQKHKARYNVSETTQEAMQSRERALLTIFYGCGLRRNEGVSLDVGDINFDRALLHVRKGKNYKERFVPISKVSLKYLTEYIYDHRPELTRGTKTEALFIACNTTKRMQGQSLMMRLKNLQYQTGNIDLIEKEVSLHTLRHSIATHFLEAGMQLESISRFLGHTSLESTQIYTHLAGLEKTTEQLYSNIPRRESTQLEES